MVQRQQEEMVLLTQPEDRSAEERPALEIEGTPAAIHRTAAALGYARGDYITDSYVGLFLAAGGRGDMVFS